MDRPFRFGVEQLETREVPSVTFTTAETIPIHAQLTTSATLTGGSTGQISSQSAVATTTRYVTHLYEDMLGREPDSAGLNQWVTALDNGSLTRGQVAIQFVTSTEYRVNTIRSYFQLQLGRAPAPSELNAFLSRLVAGETQDSLRVTFFGSEEFFNRYGRNSAEFVTQLYSQILGRTPSPAEVVNWVGFLNSTGGDRTQLATAFLTSTEYHQRQVVSEYSLLLHRSPDVNGFAFWVNQRANGVTVEAMTAGFLASGEYFVRQ